LTGPHAPELGIQRAELTESLLSHQSAAAKLAYLLRATHS
jgi:hypothetical protein